MNTIRALTYNIFFQKEDNDGKENQDWESRKEHVKNHISAIGAEVIFLQEVKQSQYNYLKTELKDEYLFFGGNEGNTEGQDQCIALKKGFFDEKTIEVHSIPLLQGEEHTTSDAVILKVNDLAGNIFIFSSVHLKAGIEEEFEKIRILEIAMLENQLNTLKNKHPNATVIGGGDFNSLPDSEVIEEFSKNYSPVFCEGPQKHRGPKHTFQSWELTHSTCFSAFIGKITKLFRNCCCCCGCCGGPTGKQIDYVFTKNAKVISSKVFESEARSAELSDHLPLLAEILYQDQTLETSSS